mmetsp:Transcript_19469/g.56002  ORF Transcript_19469/g.56002 Transcript_19469/m.56002 type:complete len:132 (+) Transcript_19469:115-510(+)
MRIISKLFLAGLALAATPAKACDSTLDIVLDLSGATGFDNNGNDFDILRELVVLTGECYMPFSSRSSLFVFNISFFRSFENNLNSYRCIVFVSPYCRPSRGAGQAQGRRTSPRHCLRPSRRCLHPPCRPAK